MDFAEILQDEKTFPDSAEIEIGGKKISLGAIRDSSKKQQAAITERMNALDTERNSVKELTDKAATLYAQLQEKEATLGKPAPAPSDDIDNDPFWQPVAKKLKSYSETEKELRDTLKSLTDTVRNAATIFARDRWDGQYERGQERLKKSAKYKDWDVDKVLGYATQNKLLDRHGLPSVERAIAELTKEDEMAIRIQEAFEKGKKEGQIAGRVGAMPRPSSATGPNSQPTSEVAKRGLEGLGDDVMNDSELTEMLANLGTLDPNDVLQ